MRAETLAEIDDIEELYPVVVPIDENEIHQLIQALDEAQMRQEIIDEISEAILVQVPILFQWGVY